jgi:hypothetical protein
MVVMPAVAMADVIDLILEGMNDAGKGVHQFVDMAGAAMHVTIATAIRGIDQVMEVMSQLIEFCDIGSEMAKGRVGTVGEAVNVIRFPFDL